jgi:hypothetical protein
MKLIRALAGKSPRGRRPITSSEFRLITLPRICGGTRVCISVMIGLLMPFWAMPSSNKARIESQSVRLSVKTISAPDQSRKEISKSVPFIKTKPLASKMIRSRIMRKFTRITGETVVYSHIVNRLLCSSAFEIYGYVMAILSI